MFWSIQWLDIDFWDAKNSCQAMKLMEAAHGSRRSHGGPDAHLVSRVPTHSAGVGPVQGFVVPGFLRKVQKKSKSDSMSCVG